MFGEMELGIGLKLITNKEIRMKRRSIDDPEVEVLLAKTEEKEIEELKKEEVKKEE